MNNCPSASAGGSFPVGEAAVICLDAPEIPNCWNGCLIIGVPAVSGEGLRSLADFREPYRLNGVKTEIRKNRLQLIDLLERHQEQDLLEPGELHLLAEEYKKEGILCLKSDMDPERALNLFENALCIHEDLIGMGHMPHTDLQPAIDDARLCQIALKTLNRSDEVDELSDLIRDWRRMQAQACRQFEEALCEQYLQDFLQDNGALPECGAPDSTQAVGND